MITSTLIKKLEPDYVVNEYGDKRSFNSEGQLHSFYDYPAVIQSNGSQYWYKDGLKHRDNDLPAVIYADGTKNWIKNGKLHRENGLPAVIYQDGYRSWWVNGDLANVEWEVV